MRNMRPVWYELRLMNNLILGRILIEDDMCQAKTNEYFYLPTHIKDSMLHLQLIVLVCPPLSSNALCYNFDTF